jgi:ubiquinone/menaquinone biosynthesis C-methylase UbiE
MRSLVGLESLAGFIVDLGGSSAKFFASMFARPEQVILVDINYNRVRQAKTKRPSLHVIVADGRNLPLADGSVEMTICNSVIEHVEDQDILAAEIRRVSRGYFLQTPNKGFPLETHSLIALPFYNLITAIWLRRLMCKILGANFDFINNVRYLSEQKLRTLFPEGTITHEKVLGLKKSFYVYLRNKDMR